MQEKPYLDNGAKLINIKVRIKEMGILKMTYVPPVNDMAFALKHSARMDEISDLAVFEDMDNDVLEAVLDEAAKLARDVWAPLNWTGDQQGAKLVDGAVKTADGFKDAYWQYVNSGWNALPHTPEFGGQGLPWTLSMATNEMWNTANMSLSLCPLLTQAAIEAIETHGSDDQKKTYLEKLISGEWAGTMNLTEPQAGTDLAAIRSIAKKDGDHYLLTGQKIFITFGDHEFTENIIHLVLARIDGLPEGNDGLGLFIVPKFMVNKDGSIGERNDVKPVSLEHKLGIHGSPTCTMQYGDNGGAKAFLVGREGEGLKNMFIMMNNARIGVGLQGVAICERAYQQALGYANERVQGFSLTDKGGDRVTIINHADVKRMLVTMKAYTEAARALAYSAGSALDFAHNSTGEEQRRKSKARVDLLTPLVKAWCTDLAVEVASMGVQVHGGMGFVEETGAAQHYRDARILPIYEGTNGVQSMDLIFRKVLRDGGTAALAHIEEMKSLDHPVLKEALKDLEDVTQWLLKTAAEDLNLIAASGTTYLKLFAMTAAGALMANQMEVAKKSDTPFHKTKVKTAAYYLEALLPQVLGLKQSIMDGQKYALDMQNEELSV